MESFVTECVIGNVNDAYRFVGTCSPYKIRKAVLSQPEKESIPVYVVAMRGTNSSLDPKDPLGYHVCLRVFASGGNIYFDLMKKAIMEKVPAGAVLVFLGHSLGGMVAQQLGADKELQSRYTILNILTMGSPYVVGRGNRCPLRRMVEWADIIPHTFSISGPASGFLGNVSHESAGYFGNPLGAHCDSYEKGDVWKKYDCFGIVNGGHSLAVAPEQEDE